MNPTVRNVRHMLKESNAIEGVYDKESITHAHKAWKYMMVYDSITPEMIKYAHKLLMKNQDIDSKYKGNWRDVPVWIGSDKKSDPPLVIGDKINKLCHHINKVIKEDDKNHQISLCCHVKFEEIHPFIDGNGRIGRIILNWQAVKMGMPLLVYTESDRRTYYRLFPGYRAQEMQKVMNILRETNFKNL